MDPASAWWWVASLGPSAILVVAIFLGREYFSNKIRAVVDGRLQERLDDRRHELAKDLAGHQAALGLHAESIRVRFSKELAEHALFTERRHDAIRALYAHVHEQIDAVLDVPRIRRRSPEHPSQARMAELGRDSILKAHAQHALYLPVSVEDALGDLQNTLSLIAVALAQDDALGRRSSMSAQNRTSITRALNAFKDQCAYSLGRYSTEGLTPALPPPIEYSAPTTTPAK